MRRFTTLVLALAILAAACADDAAPDPAADVSAEVIARVEEAMGAREEVDPDDIVIPEGCRLEIETDEYGFEVEVVVCDDEPTTTTTPGPAGSPDEWLESPDARAVANALYDLVILQEGCDDPTALTELEELTASAPDVIAAPLRAALADLDRMAANCSGDTTAWQEALEDALDDLDTLAAIVRGDPNA